jgi:rubrerythrin
MEQAYNPQEILKIAINVEQNGKELYEKLEKQAKTKPLQELWRYLKVQEEAHEKTFREMLAHYRDYVVVDFSAGEYDMYLGAIASEYIFTQETIKNKIKEKFNSAEEAIDFGISVEKVSILTYSAFREYIVDKKQSILARVIEEEKKHLVKLSSVKREIKK